MTELPIPGFYDASHAGRWEYRPDEATLFEAAAAWRERFDLKPSAQDTVTVRLQLTDLQKDFCFPESALYVGGASGRGAVEDNDRVARFIYRNLSAITEITCTLDTHFPYQIFFPSFWLTSDDRPPGAHREITADDVRSGRLRPNPALAAWLAAGDYGWLERQALSYCEQLEKAGKYTLHLWPPHCLLGSAGHALAGIIHEARMFHAFARLSRNWIEIKGGNALTEHYSALSPEVLEGPDGEPIAERNARFTERLLEVDALIIAGQAASHCVRSTIDDLLKEIQTRDPGLAGKVYILEDCMSAVVVPDPESPGNALYDFTPHVSEALSRFAEGGMNVVRSTDPLASWPDFPVSSMLDEEAEG